MWPIYHWLCLGICWGSFLLVYSLCPHIHSVDFPWISSNFSSERRRGMGRGQIEWCRILDCAGGRIYVIPVGILMWCQTHRSHHQGRRWPKSPMYGGDLTGTNSPIINIQILGGDCQGCMFSLLTRGEWPELSMIVVEFFIVRYWVNFNILHVESIEVKCCWLANETF